MVGSDISRGVIYFRGGSDFFGGGSDILGGDQISWGEVRYLWVDDIFQRASDIAKGIPSLGGADKSQHNITLLTLTATL